jgi:hypothetical protein
VDNPEKLETHITQNKEKKQQKTKTKTQHNVHCTPLSASKHK